MPGIYIAHTATTILLILVGRFFYRRIDAKDKKWFILFFLLQIPASYLTWVLVRVPYEAWYSEIFVRGELWWIFVKAFEAPLTEELAKLLPVLIFAAWMLKGLTKKRAVFLGMALGLGFGLGEVWALVYLNVTTNAEILAYPWYAFLSAIAERLMASFIHGAMTGFALYGIVQGWFRGVFGVLTAMCTHFLLNFPIFLPVLGIVSVGSTASLTAFRVAVGLYIVVFFFVMMGIVWKRGFGKTLDLSYFLGESTCVRCKKKFKTTVWRTINWGIATSQKCPHCGKWNFYWYEPRRIWRERKEVKAKK